MGRWLDAQPVFPTSAPNGRGRRCDRFLMADDRHGHTSQLDAARLGDLVAYLETL